ncbi:hypothetical protein T484DRAFT_1974459, partial [Baffinella frigidus]
MADAAASERPKRDAAKKFLASAVAEKESGKGGERAAGKDSMGLRQVSARGKASKEGKGEASNGAGSKPPTRVGAGTPAGAGVGGEEKKKRILENLPKIAVDKGIRRLDLTALKK